MRCHIVVEERPLVLVQVREPNDLGREFKDPPLTGQDLQEEEVKYEATPRTRRLRSCREGPPVGEQRADQRAGQDRCILRMHEHY
jgi:hypothetical protein